MIKASINNHQSAHEISKELIDTYIFNDLKSTLKMVKGLNTCSLLSLFTMLGHLLPPWHVFFREFQLEQKCYCSVRTFNTSEVCIFWGVQVCMTAQSFCPKLEHLQSFWHVFIFCLYYICLDINYLLGMCLLESSTCTKVLTV